MLFLPPDQHKKGTLLEPVIRSSSGIYEGWNFNSGNYLFTTDTK